MLFPPGSSCPSHHMILLPAYMQPQLSLNPFASLVLQACRHSTQAAPAVTTRAAVAAAAAAAAHMWQQQPAFVMCSSSSWSC